MVTLVLFILGAIVGSFLNVLILRLPQERKATGRSECVHCKHKLAPLDLIPVISYLSLRGKCRYCKKNISPRYIIIELVTATLFGIAAVLFPPVSAIPVLLLIRALFIICVLIVVFVIDFEEYLILDRVVFPASIAVLVLNLVIDIAAKTSLLSMYGLTLGGIVMAAVFFGLFYLPWRISEGKWIGFGDVKLMLFIGLSLAWPQTLVGLFLAFVIGGAFGSILLLLKKKSLQSKLPLGTFLAIGTALALLWGKPLLDWYWGWLGGGIGL